MTKLFSIGFSVLILLQSANIGVDDLIQLDELIEHAQFHKEKYGDSLFVFIAKHYGELKDEHNENHHEERKDHESLPFQKLYQMAGISVFLMKSQVLQVHTPNVSAESENTDFFFYQMPYKSLFISGVFHPPQIA